MAVILATPFVAPSAQAESPLVETRPSFADMPSSLASRLPQSVVPHESSAEDRFGAPPVSGHRQPVAPGSSFGVGYTWEPVLHEHTKANNELSIVEGGIATHAGHVPATYLPSIPDPSDAFMNVAVQSAMQYTQKSFLQSVLRIELALKRAKACAMQFGVEHPCLATAAGVTFDYGNMIFWIRIRPMDDLSNRREMPAGYGPVVAVETIDGMFPGPAFHRVASAIPEAGRAPGIGYRDLPMQSVHRERNATDVVIPSLDASPTSIVRFVMTTKSQDLAWIDDGFAMRRLLSHSLATLWKRAEALAKTKHSEVFDGSWISGDLKFEPGVGSWEAHSVADRVIVKIDETTSIFYFVREDGAWRIFDVAYEGTTISADGARMPRSIRSFAEDAIARFAGGAGDHSTGRRVVAKIDGLDLDKMTFRGERGTTYDHNGSEVVLFEKAGLIVYDNPKPSIALTVKRGDLLFQGYVTSSDVKGLAYTFKAGCNPAPYAVQGHWEHGNIVLVGSAPLSDKYSCTIKGYSASNSNARLVIGQTLGD